MPWEWWGGEERMILVECRLPCSCCTPLAQPSLGPQWLPPWGVVLVVIVVTEAETEEGGVTAAS